jgi:hypothetical protein
MASSPAESMVGRVLSVPVPVPVPAVPVGALGRGWREPVPVVPLIRPGRGWRGVPVPAADPVLLLPGGGARPPPPVGWAAPEVRPLAVPVLLVKTKPWVGATKEEGPGAEVRAGSEAAGGDETWLEELAASVAALSDAVAAAVVSAAVVSPTMGTKPPTGAPAVVAAAAAVVASDTSTAAEVSTDAAAEVVSPLNPPAIWVNEPTT